MRKIGWNKFWNCLTILSLKWWRSPVKTCFEIVLQCFCWSDEEIRLKQDLKLSDNIFVEVMKKSGSDVFWNCLTMFLLKPWGNMAETSIELVLEYICWSDEDVWLKQVLKPSYNIFVEVMKKTGYDEVWNCLKTFSLKLWGNLADTSFENVLEYFRWSDEEIPVKQVLKFSDKIFVEVMRKSV